MENARIQVLKAVVVADNTEEQLCVLRKIGSSGKQPAITKFSLLDIESRVSLDEELRIIADLHRTEPFIATIRATRVEQAFVGRGEFRIFEKRARV
jgi:hypothetical protein